MDETARWLSRFHLPPAEAGDRVEFLGFGAPDQFFDPETQSYLAIPNQLQPGTRGTVRSLANGQLSVDWDSGHKIHLVVAPMAGLAAAGFTPDRYAVIEPEPSRPGRRRRLSGLAAPEARDSARRGLSSLHGAR